MAHIIDRVAVLRIRTDNGGQWIRRPFPRRPSPPLTASPRALRRSATSPSASPAWLRATDDIRTRVFLAFSIANLIVFGIPTFWWLRGMTNPAKLPAASTAAVIGGARRRRAAAVPLHAGISAPPPLDQSVGHADGDRLLPRAPDDRRARAVLPANVKALTAPYVLAVIVFGFPLLVLLGFVLPIAAIVSLFRSHQEIQKQGLERLKLPLELILFSQIAGGTLASSSHRWRPSSRHSANAGGAHVMICAFGLLTPLAYAAAVWKFDVLAVDPG